MRLRLKHSLGFMSVVAVYAPTEVCETEKLFYSKLDAVLDQCPRRDALIVLGDFIAVTGTERAGYEILDMCTRVCSDSLQSVRSARHP